MVSPPPRLERGTCGLTVELESNGVVGLTGSPLTRLERGTCGLTVRRSNQLIFHVLQHIFVQHEFLHSLKMHHTESVITIKACKNRVYIFCLSADATSF